MPGWGCPHEVNDLCQHVAGARCQPGMKGCVLYIRMRASRQLIDHTNSSASPRAESDENPAQKR